MRSSTRLARRRIEALPHGKAFLHADAGHFIVNQGEVIRRFLATESFPVAVQPGLTLSAQHTSLLAPHPGPTVAS